MTRSATAPAVVHEFAPAKINLCLHVTGRRGDGYHLLDSLVAFAGIGDRLEARAADRFSLQILGRFGADLPGGDDNLVLRAARAVAPDFPVAFTLYKELPAASGIGGGSADAAAAIRAIRQLQAGSGLTAGSPDDSLAATSKLAALGADVPVCLASQTARMRGIGEKLDLVAGFPGGWVLLVNPGIEVSTPAVFRALSRRENPGLPGILPSWRDHMDLAAWLGAQRNDLEAPALGIAPVIGEVLAALRRLPGALIVRMSGSGASCFALFASEMAARAAGQSLAAQHPGWWIAEGALPCPPALA